MAAHVGTRSGAVHAVERARPAIRKVPEVTVYFWVIKVLTTAMGEATSDYRSTGSIP